MGIAKIMVTVGLAMVATKTMDDPSLYAPNVRTMMLGQPDGKRCDAANWPVDDDGCATIEQTVGILMMRHARTAAKGGNK